jgi:hypothetical protein
MNPFFPEVTTAELTKALNHLCKFEKKSDHVFLIFSDGFLAISIGPARREIAASGSWPSPSA